MKMLNLHQWLPYHKGVRKEESSFVVALHPLHNYQDGILDPIEIF